MKRSSPIAACTLVTLLLSVPFAGAPAQNTVVEYVGRYDCQTSGGPDHLLDAVVVGGNRAVIVSSWACTLVDLANLPSQGTQAYLDLLTGLCARNIYASSTHLYANLIRNGAGGSAGFAVLQVQGNTLQNLNTVEETGVFYEKMCVDGSWLYVAAHAQGIRIYSLANPVNPTLVGSLGSGFVDAWAICADGDVAYVADGGGGLKILDVSDKANPVIVAAENPASVAGTYEDVTVRKGTVYVAAGGAGLASYPMADLNQRRLHRTEGYAKHLEWVGAQLVVATVDGFTVFDPDPGGIGPQVAARESCARRGPTGRLMLCCALTAAGNDLVLASNWNYLDLHRLGPPTPIGQANVEASTQRIRFAPGGGRAEVTLRNSGSAPLRITAVSTTAPSFSVAYSGSTLPPGKEIAFEVSYDGSPTAGSGLVLLQTNDPGAPTFPIQVFGNTTHLDPGEMSVDFTMPAFSRDPSTGSWSQQPWTLSSHLGKMVWFHVYGSW
jgi:hypothetical protein